MGALSRYKIQFSSSHHDHSVRPLLNCCSPEPLHIFLQNSMDGCGHYAQIAFSVSVWILVAYMQQLEQSGQHMFRRYAGLMNEYVKARCANRSTSGSSNHACIPCRVYKHAVRISLQVHQQELRVWELQLHKHA